MKEEIPSVHLLRAEVPLIVYEFADRGAADRKDKLLSEAAKKHGLFYSARIDGDEYKLYVEEFLTSKEIEFVCRVPLAPMRTFVEYIIAAKGECTVVIMQDLEVLRIIHTNGVSIESAACVISDEVD